MFIPNLQGRFFTVEFMKKDGTIRTINGRLGVKRYLKGGKATVDGKYYLIMWSVRDKGYRAVRKDAIVRISCDGALVLNVGGK